MTTNRVAGVLARLRAKAGLSYGALAERTHAGRGWVANVERGHRWPTARSWIVAADRELLGDGELVAAWEADRGERQEEQRTRSLLSTTANNAERLLSMPDGADLDEVHGEVARLAVQYLNTPAPVMLQQTARVSSELMRRLGEGAYTAAERNDLYVAIARASGILAYSALDLGEAPVAVRHAKAVFKMASIARHNGLLAWARGTQSLIARYTKDYATASRLITDGMRYVTPRTGTAQLRLLSGAAQCAANLGDVDTAVAMLDQAEAARPSAGTDEIEGLFGFSVAKQRYYASSSLMWFRDSRLLGRAVRHAREAVEIWRHEPPTQRSLDDEALAHLYEATAEVRLGDIGAAITAVGPVLELPAERRISWIEKRLHELCELIARGPARDSREARDALDRIYHHSGPRS